MADTKNDQDKAGSNQNKGSGSDTVSAAKISAGTSVGDVGSSPMPHTQTGSGSQNAGAQKMGSAAAGSSGGMSGSAGAGGSAGSSSGSSSGSSAQSSTLASHGSKPMGGSAGATGAGRDQSRGGQSASSGSQQGGGQHGASGGMQDRAGEAYEQATEWARDTYESAASWASDTFEHAGRQGRRSMRGMGGARQGVQNYVAQNPVMVGLVGLAAGLLLGALLPRTRREDEAFGEWADEVRQQGLRYAQEMTQRGRGFVEEALGDDPRFARHESEFGAQGPGPGATSPGQGANRH